MTTKNKKQNTKTPDPILHNDLIQEVEEAVKQEQLQALWKEYGPYIIAGAVCAVLFTAMITGWRSWNESANQKQTTQIIEAMEQQDIAAALGALNGTLRPGQQAISYFSDAAMALQKEQSAAALTLYEEAAADKKLKPLWRDLATVMTVRLRLDQDDSPAADTLLKQLAPIAGNNKNIWNAYARLDSARIKAQMLQDYSGALDMLKPLTATDNAALPASVAQRAIALAHIYDIKAQQQQATRDNNKNKDEE